MAIADTIKSIEDNLKNAYTSLENKGATIPEQKNIANLSTTINSITGGSSDLPFQLIVGKWYMKEAPSVEQSPIYELNSDGSVSVYDGTGTVMGSGTFTISQNIITMTIDGQAMPFYYNETDGGLATENGGTSLLVKVNPDGSLNITQNGSYNVLGYENVDVQVSGSSVTAGEYNIQSFVNDDGTQTFDITDGDGFGQYNIASTINDDGTQTLTITEVETDFISNVPASFIIGRWFLDEGLPIAESTTYTFNKDGTFYIVDTQGNQTDGTYIIDGLNLQLTISEQESTLYYDKVGRGYSTVDGDDAQIFKIIPQGVLNIGQSGMYNVYSYETANVSIPILNALMYGEDYTEDLIITQNPSEYAFYYKSNLKGNLIIADSVQGIGSYAFRGCYGLTSVTIGNSVESIGNSAFYGCGGLTGELVIPDSVTIIDNYAFRGCNGLTSVTIGNSVESIGNSAFYDCSGLTGELVIPKNVTIISDYAFDNCSGLTSLVIPDSVTIIGSYAFSGCSGLTSVTIPDSVTTIRGSAFADCSNMIKYDFSSFSSIPTLKSDSVFTNINSNCKIVVPDDLYDEWIVATNWSVYANYIVKASEYNG